MYVLQIKEKKTHHDCHKNPSNSEEARNNPSQNGRRGIEGPPRSRAFFGFAAVQSVCMYKDPRTLAQAHSKWRIVLA